MDLQEVIERAVTSYLREKVYTSLPAKVLDVTNLNTKQTITAQPLISRVYSDKVCLEPGPVYEVPVIFPSAGGGLLSFPISVGDTVLLVYSMRSIDDWTEGNGEKVEPLDNRHYHLSDAIAIPGLYTKNTHLSPNATDVELKFSNSSIRISPTGDINITSSGNIVVNSSGTADIISVGNTTLSSQAGIDMTASGDIDITASGNVNISGSTINLN